MEVEHKILAFVVRNLHFFKVSLLVAFKPHASPFTLCPTSAQANKEAGVVPPLAQVGDWNNANPFPRTNPYLAPPPNHDNNPGQLPFLALSIHFGPAWEACPALFPETSIMWVIKFFKVIKLLCLLGVCAAFKPNFGWGSICLCRWSYSFSNGIFH